MRGSGMNWEIGIDISTLPCIKQMAGGKLLYSIRSLAWCSVMTQHDGIGGEWEGGPRRREYIIHIADTLLHTTETNTTL